VAARCRLVRHGAVAAAKIARMAANIPAFLGVAALVLVSPGPDTALVTKNALIHGRRPALATCFGVATGLLVWTLASALGIAAVVHASATAFTALKLVGAIYLVWLGIQALRAAGHGIEQAGAAEHGLRRIGARRGFRQGLISNLANPKIAVFFTSLVPQFVGSGHDVLLPSLLLGAAFAVMTVSWLSGYALVASKAAGVLTRPRVKAALDRISGCVLIGLGLRLATERR
jgi:RhtB (resistance to homoserine/threonine) family protein